MTKKLEGERGGKKREEYLAWSVDEEMKLKALLEKGYSVDECAKVLLSRNISGIRSKAKQKGWEIRREYGKINEDLFSEMMRKTPS